MDRLRNSDLEEISACIDANVLISGIAFGGKPLEVIKRALGREFHLVTGPNILAEVRKILLGKLELDKLRVETFLSDYSAVASVFVPEGKVQFIAHKGDNLVLELALAGECDVLVTGDRKHLLPLSPFKGLIIESPAKFLDRLESVQPKK